LSRLTSEYFIARVEQVKSVSTDVFILQLQLDANTTFRFCAGQYLHLRWSAQDERTFSIASAPCELPQLTLHIRAGEKRSPTTALRVRLEVGKEVLLRGPEGRCLLPESARHIAFIVGGTGFAPVCSMLRQHLPSVSTTMSLYWGARSERDLYDAEAVRALTRRYPQLTFIPVLSHSDDVWEGATGLVHQHALDVIEHPVELEFVLAGSRAMAQAVYVDLLSLGVPGKQIHSDMLDILRDSGELSD